MLKFGKTVAALCAAAVSVAAETLSNGALKPFPDTFAPLSQARPNKTPEYAEALKAGALSALRAGMASLAQTIVEDAAASAAFPKSFKDSLLPILADALIAQGNFEQAEKIPFESAGSDALNPIRRALISVGLSKPEEAEKILSKVDPAALPAEAKPWYFVAKGYICYARGDMKKALENFGAAKSKEATKFALADITVAEIFCKIEEAETKPESLAALEKSLAGKSRLYFGTAAGLNFAKQRAAVLFRLGRRDEAIEELNAQLDIELSPDIDKDEIRVVAAAMTKNPQIQLQMLREILASTNSSSVGDFAAAMLAKNPEISSADRKAFLLELLERGSDKIRDRILLELSKAAVKSRNADDAAKYAGRLIDEYPASKYKKDAMLVLAWTAFSAEEGKKPEYRLAATYMSKLAEIEPDAKKSAAMRLIAADCFFLDGDFATAAKLYADLFSSPNANKGVALNRAIDANIKLGDFASAQKLLDRAYADGKISDDDIWNAEWKIVSLKNSRGEYAESKARIERAVAEGKRKELLLKMRWLLARIAEQSGDLRGAAAQCDKISARLENGGSQDPAERALVEGNAMLMKARCLEALGETAGENGAFAQYKKLREKYPQSDAAKVSYLYQARAESSRGNYAAAQQLCRALAEADPKGAYVYDAVTDAAKYSAKIGTEAEYKAALAALDKLCADFPDNPRNFYTRLAQAEILRLINAFADARKLYEDIANRYSKHPEVFLAWMGLGDCVLAQPTKSLNAAGIFERLYALPDIPDAAKAEAAFKCAFALERAGRTREANEMRWVTAGEMLKRAGDLSPAAKYWVGRSLFSLASSLEAAGSKRDARAAYELIVKHALPSSRAAEAKLKNALK